MNLYAAIVSARHTAQYTGVPVVLRYRRLEIVVYPDGLVHGFVR